MTSSRSLNDLDGSSRLPDYPEIWQDCSRLGLAFAVPLEQIPDPLQDLDIDRSSMWTQPEAPPSYAFASNAFSRFNPHIPFNSDGQPRWTDHQPTQYDPSPSFHRRDSRQIPTSVLTTYQPSTTFHAPRPPTHHDDSPQGGSAGSYSSVHGASEDHLAFAHSPYNHGSLAPIAETESLSSAMRALSLCDRIPPVPGGMMQSSTAIPSASAHQRVVSPVQALLTRRDSRLNRHIKSSPYHSTWTLSLPASSINICRWVRGDGTLCGAQITPTSVPQHLVLHGIKKLSHGHLLSCGWFGCRLKGDKDEMNRESIVRHVREKHLGCKRTLNSGAGRPACRLT